MILVCDDPGPDGEELDRVAAPAVALLLQVDPDDPLGLSSCASFCMRSIASSRASYSAWVKFVSSTFRPVWAIDLSIPRCATW